MNQSTSDLPLGNDGDNTSLFESIANDIAAHGFSIQPNRLPPFLLHQLSDHLLRIPEASFKRAGVGRDSSHHLNDFVRTDEISWITGDTDVGREWLRWAESLQLYLNRRLFLGLFSFESHFAHYSEGDFYKKHNDAFKGQQNRVLSLVVYLNRVWGPNDGGELVIYVDEQSSGSINPPTVLSSSAEICETIKVIPGYGTIVAFLSEEFAHEVLPAARDRYSIAGWYRLNTGV